MREGPQPHYLASLAGSIGRPSLKQGHISGGVGLQGQSKDHMLCPWRGTDEMESKGQVPESKSHFLGQRAQQTLRKGEVKIVCGMTI